MGRVLVTRRLPDGGLDPLAAHDLVGPNDDDTPFTPDELRAHAREVDGIVCVLTDQIDAALLDAGAAGRLRVVANVAVGYDNIDVAAARERNVVVCNTPGVLDDTTADLAFTLILGAARLARDAEADLRAGRWQGWGITQYLGRDVHHATLGIVGYGHIGTQVGVLAESLGMRVIFYDIVTKLALGNVAAVKTLEDLLGQADVVSLHVPDTAATRGMIGQREVGLMRPGAALINASRGLVVDVEALARAIESGQLSGAALDVFPLEPGGKDEAFTSPLTKLDQVILTPHIGGSTEEAQEAIGREVADKLIHYSNLGSTLTAVNFPEVSLSDHPGVRRLIHIHQNRPGMLSQINAVFSKHNVNVNSESLETDRRIGYVVIDVEVPTDQKIRDVRQELEGIDGTIRTRVLY